MAKKRNKRGFILVFCGIVLLLVLIKLIFPGICKKHEQNDNDKEDDNSVEVTQQDVVPDKSSSTHAFLVADADESNTSKPVVDMMDYTDVDSMVAFNGANYLEAFNDSNHVQLVAAQTWGVPPVKNRKDAEARKDEVVYMGMSPFYDVAYLDASIPYLVPRASLLLHDIGVNFFDSLQSKGMPLHRVMVSSVLRSEEDVARLRRGNKNAVEQSCHLWGTTFDINYTVFLPVGHRAMPAEKMKRVLGEVLSDLHLKGRCYIKHEVKQPCFHITVR